ncbi:hypothetical protein DFJ73DRAFT_850690 [Zopfochytrium polystomum]|nr:hypothetical protein DFJ73DRAFT_850690 [Zopfochytrium polystomum]
MRCVWKLTTGSNYSIIIWFYILNFQIIFASTAAATIGLPSIFNCISSLRSTSGPVAQAQGSGIGHGRGGKTDGRNGGQAGGSNRAKSYNAVPTTSSQATLASSSPVVKVDAGLSRCGSHQIAQTVSPPPSSRGTVRFDPDTIYSSLNSSVVKGSALHNDTTSDHEDWDAELDAADSGVGTSHTSSRTSLSSQPVPLRQLHPFPVRRAPAQLKPTAPGAPGSRAPPLPPFQSRRIQSAPSIAQSRFAEDLGCGSGVTDALLEDDEGDDTFIVPSVRQKVVARREKELERSVSADAGLESWDDDFVGFGGDGVDNNEGGLRVPDGVMGVQKNLKVDMENFRRFALHVEDLKLLHADAKLMAKGLATDHPDLMAKLTASYQLDLDRAEMLVDLGEYSDHSPDKFVTNDRNLETLNVLLWSVQQGGEAKDGKRSGPSESSSHSTLCELKEVTGQGARVLQVGGEIMPVLIRSVGSTKARLKQYVVELRQVALQ